MLSVAYKNSVGARRTAWRTISAIQQKEEYKGSRFIDIIKGYRAKIEKELGLKEKENKDLRIQLKMINLAMADVS